MMIKFAWKYAGTQEVIFLSPRITELDLKATQKLHRIFPLSWNLSFKLLDALEAVFMYFLNISKCTGGQACWNASAGEEGRAGTSGSDGVVMWAPAGWAEMQRGRDVCNSKVNLCSSFQE